MSFVVELAVKKPGVVPEKNRGYLSLL